MAKRASDFAQQNTERAMEMTAYGMDWMREFTERNLEQTKTAVESLLTITRKAVDDLDHQTSVIREHSLSLAEETLANAFDFAHRALHVREPQQLAQLQSEFVSRQAQALGDRRVGKPRRIAFAVIDAANDVQRDLFAHVITFSKFDGEQITGTIECAGHDPQSSGIINTPGADRWNHLALLLFHRRAPAQGTFHVQVNDEMPRSARAPSGVFGNRA